MEGKKYGNEIQGIKIVDDILNDRIEIEDKLVRPYLKLFAMVYYTIGNMLPAKSNPMRLNCRDTWRNKILVLLNYIDESNIKWKKQSFQNDSEKIEFIKGYCLNDFIGENIYPKPFFEGIEDENQVFFSKGWSINEKKQWFLNNSKLIIERSHRIINCSNDEFYGEDGKRTIKSKEEIESFFESIFKMVGTENDVDITLY